MIYHIRWYKRKELVREPEGDDDIIILENVTDEINSGESGVLVAAPDSKKENNSL